MKRTQIVTHLMPSEVEEYSDLIDKLTEAQQFLEDTDWISIYATLNISGLLIDWTESSLQPDFFIDKFKAIQLKCQWANELIFEVVEDSSILGTTAQKRRAISKDYDQFIFLDCDIAFHPSTLKYVLEASYQVQGKYFITPQTVKLWDYTWDVLTHPQFMQQPYGYEKQHHPIQTYNQDITSVEVETSPAFKFGCGWFTLYSKEILDFIGIPQWLGHYGPEDTYLMFASQLATAKGYDIKQYILNGVYVSENYVNRSNPYSNELKVNNLKDAFRKNAESQFAEQLNKFSRSLQSL